MENKHEALILELAVYCSQGIERPKDMEASVEFMIRDAELKDGRAMAILGVMSLQGDGMPKDLANAEEYFSDAEVQGFDVDGFLGTVGISRSG